jgi:hypothetical protein
MVTPSRRAPAQPAERAPRRAPKAAPNLLPVFATLGVVVLVALVVTLMANKAKDEDVAQAAGDTSATATGTGANPFSDINTDPEQFMRKSGDASRPATTHNAPPGLADAPVFQEARKIVAEAKVLVEAAVAAEKAADNAAWSEKANAAREKLEQAMEMTAVWQFDLESQWGSNDAQLRQIQAEIETWGKLLKKVRKAQ